MNSKLKSKSRRLSYILRHDLHGLKMNNSGYVLVDDILSKLEISKLDLDLIVSENDKQRFSFDENHQMIRANQGHSKKMKIDIPMKVSERIDNLYHGTSKSALDSIIKEGIVSKSRKHVHLSIDKETAYKVGLRHTKDVVILVIDSASMRADDIKIWISDNGVYLTDYVDLKYIKFL